MTVTQLAKAVVSDRSDRAPRIWGSNSSRQVAAVLVGICVVVSAACGTSTGRESSLSSAPGKPTGGSVAGTMSATATTAGAGSASGVVFGIDVNQFDRDIGPSRVPQVLEMIHQAGATAVRIGAGWSNLEPSPGKYDWAPIDRLFSLANADGLTVLYELGTEPAWDAIGGNSNAPPIDCATYDASCASVAGFVSALVAHAAGEGLRYLIVRNEPQNFNKNWVGGSADAFAHFEQVVYDAAHRADPNIAVLNGGTEFVSASLEALRDEIQPPTAYERQASAFSSSLYANRSWCDSLDILDIHVGDHGPVYSPEIVDSSEEALQRCNGGRHVPVWVTEVGYPSIAALQSFPLYQTELGGAYLGGETGQARFLTDTFTALRKDPNVIGIDWTFMIDPNTTDTVPPGATYNETFSAGMGAGLAYASYRTKLSYQAFQAVAGVRP